MSENFKQQAEVSIQNIESANSPADKVNAYQKLADDSLRSFYSNVDKLVTGKDGQALKQLAYNRVVGMNAEIQSRLDQIQGGGSLAEHNNKMLDSIVSTNIQSLIKLGSATKESLDNLINTGLTDYKGLNKYKINNPTQLSSALDEIMKVEDLGKAGSVLADKANAPDGKKSTASNSTFSRMLDGSIYKGRGGE